MSHCHVHNTKLVCPACNASHTSEKKATAARVNGTRGGRPWVATIQFCEADTVFLGNPAKWYAFQSRDKAPMCGDYYLHKLMQALHLSGCERFKLIPVRLPAEIKA